MGVSYTEPNGNTNHRYLNLTKIKMETPKLINLHQIFHLNLLWPPFFILILIDYDNRMAQYSESPMDIRYVYCKYHFNPPPPFLADIGVRSNICLYLENSFKTRYHTNSPPPFLSDKNVSGGGGINMISTVCNFVKSNFTRYYKV